MNESFGLGLSLFWWAIPALIVYLIWYRIARPQKREMKISLLTIVFAIILTIIVTSFFTLVWKDITDLVTQGKSLWEFSKQERAALQFKSILYHTSFVIPVVVLALMLYFGLYKRGLQYSAVIMPYLIGSLFVVIRLLFNIGSYVVMEYKKAGIYAVLAVLMVVFSGIVFFVQQKWEERKKEQEGIS